MDDVSDHCTAQRQRIEAAERAHTAQRQRIEAALRDLPPTRRPYPAGMGQKLRKFEFAEIRVQAWTDKQPLIRGLIPFYQLAAPQPYFQEQLLPGVFEKSLDTGRNIVCALDHDRDEVLGQTAARTLAILEDERGLHFACPLPATACGHRAFRLLRSGPMGASFSFSPDGQRGFFDKRRDGKHLRQLFQCHLHEVAVVEQGAYPGARAWLELPPLENKEHRNE